MRGMSANNVLQLSGFLLTDHSRSSSQDSAIKDSSLSAEVTQETIAEDNESASVAKSAEIAKEQISAETLSKKRTHGEDAETEAQREAKRLDTKEG